jgi:hypothetical protein
MSTPMNKNTMSLVLESILNCPEIEEHWAKLLLNIGFLESNAATTQTKIFLIKYTCHARGNQFILDFAREENIVTSTSKKRQGVQSTTKAYMIVKDEKFIQNH